MTTILAIDAAWTPHNPSGVALVASQGHSPWRCVAVAPSYAAFVALAGGAPVDWQQRSFPGSVPDIPALLDAAARLANDAVDVIAVDMPLAMVPFSARRAADDAVSREFGGRWCSAHTPNSLRPGPFGAAWMAAALASGFPLCTADPDTALRSGRRLLEVYPHPALLALLDRPRRVPYKVDKRRDYWPDLTNDQRKQNLLVEFDCIHKALTRVFGPLPMPVPRFDDFSNFSTLKRFEDGLDALVCAWVGVKFMAGEAVALGDGSAAIWCPAEALLTTTQVCG